MNNTYIQKNLQYKSKNKINNTFNTIKKLFRKSVIYQYIIYNMISIIIKLVLNSYKITPLLKQENLQKIS